MSREAFLVEQPMIETRLVDGEAVKVRVGTAEFWTQNKEKAIHVASERPDLGRTWRQVPWEEVPTETRERFERAQREAAAGVAG